MEVTIDQAGRVVIPKPVRDELGLAPGTRFDLIVGEIGITLEPVIEAPRLYEDDRGWLVVDADGPPPDPDEILRIRDDLRR